MKYKIMGYSILVILYILFHLACYAEDNGNNLAWWMITSIDTALIIMGLIATAVYLIRKGNQQTKGGSHE